MNRKQIPRWAELAILASLLLLSTAWPAHALDVRGGDNIVIAVGEVVEDDLIIGAGTFTLEGTIEGDLVVAGGTITIGPEGVVEGDLIAAGQTVIVNGTVRDDARLAGAALTVGEGATIGDDLVGAGYSLETKAGSTIGGTLLFAGGQALLAGETVEDVHVSTGGLSLQGGVGGNVRASVGTPEDMPPFSPLQFIPNAPRVPTVAGGLTVGPEARIGGSLNYTSTREFTVPSGVVTGAVTRHEEPAEVEAARPISAGERALDWFLKNLRNLVTLLLVGLLLVWLAPDLVKRGADALQARPLPSLGWGFVSYLVVFAAALALIVAMILLALLFGFFTLGKLAGTVVVIGIVALAALILAFIIATSFISKIVVSCLGGHLILARVKPDWAGHRVWPVILGVVIFAILAAIPYLGWWINLIVILFGLGVLWLLGGQALQRRPTTA